MPITPLPTASPEDTERLLDAPSPVLVYKHSYACGLSDLAFDQVRRFSAAHPAVPIVLVDVIAQRPAAQAIEAHLGVRHESPQLLLVHERRALWHASHRRVTEAAVADAWAAAGAAR